jgi:hypothetical protein
MALDLRQDGIRGRNVVDCLPVAPSRAARVEKIRVSFEPHFSRIAGLKSRSRIVVELRRRASLEA